MGKDRGSLEVPRVFSILEANKGYLQIEIDGRDRDKATFFSHHGLHWLKRMPFGQKNAPSTMYRVMDVKVSSPE